MTYLMHEKAYWRYIEKHGFTHEELIKYLNSTLCLRYEITAIEIVEGDAA